MAWIYQAISKWLHFQFHYKSFANLTQSTINSQPVSALGTRYSEPPGSKTGKELIWPITLWFAAQLPINQLSRVQSAHHGEHHKKTQRVISFPCCDAGVVNYNPQMFGKADLSLFSLMLPKSMKAHPPCMIKRMKMASIVVPAQVRSLDFKTICQRHLSSKR